MTIAIAKVGSALRSLTTRAALGQLALTAAVAGAYFGVAKLGLAFAFANTSVTAIWPPTGLALAAVLLLGYRIWPGVFLGAFLANVTTAGSLAAVGGIATGNTLEALCGAYLLRRVRFRPSLDRMRDVVALVVLAGALSTIVSATIGVFSLWADGLVDEGSLASTWRVWWLGDMGGDLLIAPLLLVLASRPSLKWRLPAIAEAVGLAAALTGVSLLTFPHDGPIAYVAFPLLFWTALRFRQPGAVVAGLLVSGIAVWYTAHGQGPFIGGLPDAELLRAQTFVGVATITALLVAAVRSERQLAEDAERELAEAQKLAHIGSWEWDIPNDVVRWSEELYRIYGLDRQSFGGSYEGFLERVHPEDRESTDHIVRKAYEDRAPFHYGHRIVRPDGQVRTLQAHGEVVCGEDGEPVLMRGTGQDISAQVDAEERFRSLLESAPDAMVIANDKGEIVLVNSQAQRIFGYSRDEMVGKPVEMLVPERFRGSHRDHRAHYVREPSPRPMGTGLDLYARRKDGSEFPVEVSLSPLQTEGGVLVSSAIRDVTERKKAEAELAHQAVHDPLTGLPNRTLLLDRLEHALDRARRPGAILALLFCDLDQFKVINDTLGHRMGDKLLCALTPRLQEALRPGDTIARFGGDEFAVLCEDLRSEADATRIAERIARVFSRPVVVDGKEHYITVSTGIVIAKGGKATATDVLRDADAAMYRAKAGGPGRYELFDRGMRERLVERLRTESDLRKSLEGGGLQVLYQPVVSLADGSVVAAEALLRWPGPDGLRQPKQFIEVAEESGLIVPLGGWVLSQACRQAAEWEGGAIGSIGVSVNLSPRQVGRSDIVRQISKALDGAGMDPARLELEITEGVLMERTEATVKALRDLKSLGVRLVLDDFGTGYSSLGYLKRFPIDTLKIDRSFVDGLGSDPEDAAIVTAIMSMAGSLGIGVIAEGVETEAQLAHLRELGCTLAQGFLFSPPVPPEAVPARIVAAAGRAGAGGAVRSRDGAAVARRRRASGRSPIA